MHSHRAVQTVFALIRPLSHVAGDDFYFWGKGAYTAWMNHDETNIFIKTYFYKHQRQKKGALKAKASLVFAVCMCV